MPTMDGPKGQNDNDRKGELLYRSRRLFGMGDEKKRPGADEHQPPGANGGNEIRPDAGALFTEYSEGRRQRDGDDEKSGDFSAGWY